MQYVLNATEKELIRNNHMNQINLYNPDIVQDNADLAELAVRFDNLDLPSADRRIINDYIASHANLRSSGERFKFCVNRKN